ncbi:hypothetical protein Ari01nite_21110 [Paractinoplanes rishiriensis]|uniref:Uncharacterized protein n=1 Tax=Paractinoplanes rishiriensis TaxID=1050105 RepID=A0A919K111_9ACTN|nr:hypothetical protein Ari01nite_21110 [Actinoplanes rishiriensis]
MPTWGSSPWNDGTSKLSPCLYAPSGPTVPAIDGVAVLAGKPPVALSPWAWAASGPLGFASAAADGPASPAPSPATRTNTIPAHIDSRPRVAGHGLVHAMIIPNFGSSLCRFSSG